MFFQMLRLALAGLALAGSAALAQGTPPAAPWPHESSDLTPDPDVRFGRLPNGLRYALRRGQTPPGAVSIRLRIGLGSVHERDDQRGLAHFLEHMVLNGTSNVPEGEFMRRLERHGLRMGADTNAFTDWTQTVFKLDLPQANAEAIDTALFLLREIADEASLTQAAIDTERGIVQSEERSRAGAQLNAILSELDYLMPGQLAARRQPGGLPEVIATATRERFVALYNAFYRPERATLVMVGDLDLDEMERRIGARFGSWRGQGPAGTDPDLGTPGRRRTAARLYVEAAAPPRISLSWVRPADRRPDGTEARVEQMTDQVALQIFNRRLERIAATQSPAPFLAAFGLRTRMLQSSDLTQVSAFIQPSQWRQGLHAIETERHRLVAEGVTRAEFDREVELVTNTLAGVSAGTATQPSVETADAIVASVDERKVYTSAADNLALFQTLSSRLNVRRVNRAARAMFSGDPIIHMTSPTPVEGGEGALLAAYEAANDTRVAAVADRPVQPWPYTDFGTPGTVAERRELPAGVGATAIRFANGVRLTVKHTEFTDDLILIAVRVGRGRLGLPANRALPPWAFPAAMLGGGFGRISHDDMQQTLSGRASIYGAAIEDGAFLFTGSGRGEYVTLQLQILAAQVSDPGWQPSGWDRMRGVSGAAYDMFNSTPGGVMMRDGAALFHSGDRRWATPSREEMAAMTMADVRALVEDPITRGSVEVIIVGDITVEDAIRQVAATFGALPRRPDATVPTTAAPGPFPPPATAPVRLTHSGRADQALAMIAWPAGDYYADIRRAQALDLLSDVFTSRLLQEIRERQGASYSPRSGHDASRLLPGYGLFLGAIEAQPEALAGFLRDAGRIAADLRDRPVEADELRRALQPRVESLQRERNSNVWWLENLAGIQQNPRVADGIVNELASYRAITPVDLQRVAREVLQPDRAWSLLVVPRQGAAAPAQASPATPGSR